ncbi:hypothetical protein F4604DRAFT_1928762 [Suillus subluteus]|nr:hypothetical protein F4604DRAFT_1928762 [Suillus subluteus]
MAKLQNAESRLGEGLFYLSLVLTSTDTIDTYIKDSAHSDTYIKDSAHSDTMHKTDWALKWIPDQRSIFGESSPVRKTDWALKWIPDQHSIFDESSLVRKTDYWALKHFLLSIRKADWILPSANTSLTDWAPLTDWALKWITDQCSIFGLTVLGLPTLLIDTYIKYSAHSDAMCKTDWALKWIPDQCSIFVLGQFSDEVFLDCGSTVKDYFIQLEDTTVKEEYFIQFENTTVKDYFIRQRQVSEYYISL